MTAEKGGRLLDALARLCLPAAGESTPDRGVPPAGALSFMQENARPGILDQGRRTAIEDILQ
jgi:hypothetical protein